VSSSSSGVSPEFVPLTKLKPKRTVRVPYL
jgi:hypothetical protein